MVPGTDPGIYHGGGGGGGGGQVGSGVPRNLPPLENVPRFPRKFSLLFTISRWAGRKAGMRMSNTNVITNNLLLMFMFYGKHHWARRNFLFLLSHFVPKGF